MSPSLCYSSGPLRFVDTACNSLGEGYWLGDGVFPGTGACFCDFGPSSSRYLLVGASGVCRCARATGHCVFFLSCCDSAHSSRSMEARARARILCMHMRVRATTRAVSGLGSFWEMRSTKRAGHSVGAPAVVSLRCNAFLLFFFLLLLGIWCEGWRKPTGCQDSAPEGNDRTWMDREIPRYESMLLPTATLYKLATMRALGCGAPLGVSRLSWFSTCSGRRCGAFLKCQRMREGRGDGTNRRDADLVTLMLQASAPGWGSTWLGWLGPDVGPSADVKLQPSLDVVDATNLTHVYMQLISWNTSRVLMPKAYILSLLCNGLFIP